MSADKFDEMVDKGESLYYEEEFDEAEEILRQAIAMGESEGRADLSMASALNTLSGVLREAGDDDEALALGVRSFDLMEKVAPAGDSDLGGIAGNIGQMYLEMGNLTVAREWTEKAIAIHEVSADDEHNPQLHAMAYNSLGEICGAQDDTAGEVEACFKGYQIARKGHLRDTDARLLTQWSQAVMDEGRVEEAATELQALLGEYQEQMAAEQNPAAFLSPQGALFEMIKEEYKEHNREPMAMLMLRIMLAKALRRLGREESLIETMPEMGLFQSRVEGEESLMLGAQYQAVGVQLHFLGQEFENRNDLERARDFYLKSIPIMENQLESGDEKLEEARENLEEVEDDLKNLG